MGMGKEDDQRSMLWYLCFFTDMGEDGWTLVGLFEGAMGGVLGGWSDWGAGASMELFFHR